MLSEKPWTVDSLLRLALGLLGCMLLGGFAIGWVGGEDGGNAARRGEFLPILVGTLSFHWMTFVLVHFFLREHQISWSAAFGFNTPQRIPALFLALGAAIVALPIAWFLGHLSAKAMLSVDVEPVTQPTVMALKTAVAIGPQIYLGAVAVLIAPTAEELLFRGVLYPFARQRVSPRLALWSTSILFAFVHANVMTFVPLMFLALVLTWLYERTGNLLAPILAHSLFNLANLLWLVIGRAMA